MNKKTIIVLRPELGFDRPIVGHRHPYLGEWWNIIEVERLVSSKTRKWAWIVSLEGTGDPTRAI
jgi:hypothetical protein